MQHRIVEGLKAALRPIVRHRTLLERAKYIGTTILDPAAGNSYIAKSLLSGRPWAIGKMGGTEIGGLRRFEATKDELGISHTWGAHRKRLFLNAGVYPDDNASLSRFCLEFSQTLGNIDILAAWYQRSERYLTLKFAPQAMLVALTALEPYYHSDPWSHHLASKRVLVISPFANTIKRQYERREEVWASLPGLLPAFQLRTIRCPLSAALVEPTYPDWFTALNSMCREMDESPYDVAIVGAGAWSLPLVAYAKRSGKWAIHLGGGTQLLFGVRGGRWDNSEFFTSIYNDAWVRPDPADRPDSAGKVENACYW